MRGLLQPERRLGLAAALLALASIGGLLALAQQRGSWSAVAGDESTFLAMTESLALDGDLEFTGVDRARLEAAEPPARRTVILQRAGDRIAYSKPVVYPLAAAPLFALFGRGGLAALNALALAAGLGLFWRTVPSGERRGAWLLTIATFAATGAVLPQIAWSTGDALQLALALAGASLALGGGGRSPGPATAVAGGLLLGCLVAMRLPNAILAAGVAVALGAGGRARRGLAVGAAAAAGVGAVLVLNIALIGSPNPYRAERATFNRATGYPAGADREQALEQFVEGRATQRLAVRPEIRPRSSAYAALYFLVGRHTGALIYFPAAVVLLGAAVRGAGHGRLALQSAMLLGTVAGLAAFYLIWMPENYFGGASFVGNRYLLPALALLLPALARPPRTGPLIAVWLVSGVLFVSALVSVTKEGGGEFSSQSHAYSGLFRYLPYESTALAIEDREDRYLSDEFLRFVDPNAEVGEHGFRLAAGAAPAEILLATPRPSGVLRFLVWVDAPGAELVYSDWRGEQRFALRPLRSGAGGPVEIAAAPAWRRHPFWWTDSPWRAHVLRLSIRVPEAGVPARAELRHLGPYRLAAKFFAYDAAPVELPRRAPAGSVSRLPVRLVNRGRRPWASDADVPIHLVHTVRAVAAGDAAGELRFTPIERTVDRREEITLPVEVRWPRQPGSYRVEIDLAAGGVALFEQWLERPVAAGVVEVVPAASEDAGVLSSG